MKKLTSLFCLALVCTALLAPQAVRASNITIFDGRTSSNSWYTGTGVGSEDQEVEPGCVPGDQWDLEGFSLSGRNLSIVSSYNFTASPSGGAPGDIFISTTGPGSYNYVLDMNYTAKTYQLIALTGSYALASVTESINVVSNPWAYTSGGQALGGGSFTINSFTGNGTYADVAVTGSTNSIVHHVLTVGLPNLGDFASAIPESYFHFTMNCGNDNLLAHAQAAPIPGAVLLLGAGLARLAAYARRRRSA